MTEEEQRIMAYLVAARNAFVSYNHFVPVYSEMAIRSFESEIFSCENIILARAYKGEHNYLEGTHDRRCR